VVYSVLLLDTPFANVIPMLELTRGRQHVPFSTPVARARHNVIDHTMQMHDKLDNRRETAARVSIDEKVSSRSTLRICTTPLGLPPQSIVLWQVCKLHIYAIGVCCFCVDHC
jgi:hypothetical protein